MRVVSGGDQQEIGRVTAERWHYLLLEGCQVLVVSFPAGERNIEGVSLALPLAFLLSRPGAGIEGIAMRGNIKDVAAVVEGPLSAVAVMDVEVHDGDTSTIFLTDRVFGGYRHIIEDAKSHRARDLRVMAGRTNEGERVAHLSINDSVDRVQ